MSRTIQRVMSVLLVLLFASLASGQAYYATRLKMPKNTTPFGVSMNASGQIAGYFCCYSAFFWSPSTGTINLGSLGGGMSAALGINDGGQVVGWSQTDTGEYHEFLWTQTGGMQDLGIGVDFYDGGGINDSGQVVGTLLINSGGGTIYQGFLWSQSTGTENLGALDGGTDSFAVAINNSGQVVGSAYSGCNLSGGVPFLWTAAAGMQPLIGCTLGIATAISDNGQVAGDYVTGPGPSYEAFYWSLDGGMQDIGPAPGCCPLYGPSGVNDSGQVVGTLAGRVAFLWNQATGTQDLNSLIPKDAAHIGYAGSINNAGQIVAWGKKSTFLLTPRMGTVLTSSLNPSDVGQPVTFTATVSSIAGPPPDGELVTFYNGDNVIGTGTTANGVAAITTSSLTAKTHTIKATYAGDATYKKSSGTVTQVVEQ